MKNRLIVALDVVDKRHALRLVENLIPVVDTFKVGSVLFTSCGPEIIKEIKRIGGGIFLDLKFHDIPKVVAQAAERAAHLGVDMMTVHTLGGEEMLRAAAGAIRKIRQRPRILGVTVLTSLDNNDMKTLGIRGNCMEEVKRLASLAINYGLDGIVASSREVKTLREILPRRTIIVTPGIRLEGGTPEDQKRIMTPREAIKSGASYIVIGRPVIGAKNPREVVEKILVDITCRC